MKFTIGVLLSVVAVINAAAIDDVAIAPYIIAPDSLFVRAHEYQTAAYNLQQDIDEQLTVLRIAVSTVLKHSSNETLAQIEENAQKLFAQDQPTRNEIYSLSSSLCVNNLKVLLNSITEFSGFGSSNCVTTYDKKVQDTLSAASVLLQRYQGTFGNVLQIVVRSFIGKNVFLEPQDIETRFIEEFSKRNDEWQQVRPDVEEFRNTLSGTISAHNQALEICFKNLQNDVAPSYGLLYGEISTCQFFDNTADPFASFRL